MAVVAKRTVLSLYSDPQCPYSHQVRIVLSEKAVNVEITHIKPDTNLEDLYQINPYGSTPTLIDRELILFESRIIMEYLDERFPHPPLLPVYPVARAESRKMMYRIERDWYSLMKKITSGETESMQQARQDLAESLFSLEPVFSSNPYFLSEEFSLVDCALAPLLWRLPMLGIKVPETNKSLREYMQRVFDRDSFKASLTENEKELRELAA